MRKIKKLRILGIDRDDWPVIIAVAGLLTVLALISFLVPGLNLWDEWLSSVWS